MRAIVYPAYSLDVVEGTLAYIEDLEAIYYYDWPDIRDRNYRFWDSIGREISFELFEGERGPDFRPVIADDAPLIGKPEMLMWAQRFGLDSGFLRDADLATIYSTVVRQSPDARTGCT
jgi:hypothetical protein